VIGHQHFLNVRVPERGPFAYVPMRYVEEGGYLVAKPLGPVLYFVDRVQVDEATCRASFNARQK
jgi:hypothetical protein